MVHFSWSLTYTHWVYTKEEGKQKQTRVALVNLRYNICKNWIENWAPPYLVWNIGRVSLLIY
jgi:hypothetical protein